MKRTLNDAEIGRTDSMTRATKLVMFFGLLTLAPGTVRIGFPAKPVAEIPVTVTFRDFAGDSGTPPDRILSDGKGGYIGGIDNVDAVFTSSGDLRLVTNISRTPPIRTLLLDFRNLAISIGDNLKPFDAGLAQVDMDSRIMTGDCSSSFSSTGLRDLPLGTTKFAAVLVKVPDPNSTKVDWSVRRGPYVSQADCAVATHQQDGTGEFWALEANWPNDVAALAKSGPNGSFTVEGYYHMPFKVTIRKK